MGWGLPYFTSYVATSWKQYAPIDVAYSKQKGSTQYALLDAVRFPSDPASVILEQNQIVFKFRSDSQSILQSTENALFVNTTSGAYIGDLFDLTSKRTGFLGRGFGTVSVANWRASMTETERCCDDITRLHLPTPMGDAGTLSAMVAEPPARP